MDIKSVDSISVSVSSAEETTSCFTRFSELPAPASSTAIPIETAKASVLAAPYLTSMMMPTADGIYSIGAVSVKTSSIGALGSLRGFSSWGF